MRFAIVLLVLAAICFAAPAPAPAPQGGGVAAANSNRRNPTSDLIALLLSLLRGFRGGRGIRGGHPTIPFPSGTTTIKPTTLPATTIPATTLPATTLSATTIGSTVLSATTVPATTLPATTLPASTISATTVVVDPVTSATSSAPASTTTVPGPVDCVVAPQDLPAAATSAATGALPAVTGTFVGSFTGIGTQNYDCSSGNATAAPSSIGANANLTGTCGTGIHTFDNPTTPRFDMSMLGITTAQKNAAMTSPDGATNVPWLNLKILNSTGSIISIYRVNTKGGVAPATCGTETGVVRVNYEASYFFYQVA